jgi:hypothetical protein
MSGIGDRARFENEDLGVRDDVIEPGKESPVHRHNHDYLVMDVEGDRLIHNPPKDGHFPRMESEMKPGSVTHIRGAVTETAINVGATRARVLMELLDHPR